MNGAASTAYELSDAWSGLPEARRTTFAARRDALRADVVRPLRRLYGHRPDFDEIVADLEGRVARAYARRPDSLHALDDARLCTPDWFQQSRMLGYVCYTDRFAGRLVDIPARLDYLQELGVNYLHLMPLLRPRSGANDGGYAVESYREVDPRLGNVDDLRHVADELRSRGMSLVVDLVCNHTAKEHEWARRAACGDPEFRDFYYFYPDRELPDRWERTLPEVFPDFAPGNFTWDERANAWVWTTFNDYQWDLNYTNPQVLGEMLDVILWLANLGVEVVRLDAVAFMWKRMGTNCQNQPEAHAILQAFRALSRIACPATILLAEAIVSPEDLVPYLGVGEATGKECELAYHNVLMVSLWSALAEGDVRLLSHTIERMPPIPSSSAWLTYARLHDDIGWAVTDENAASVGLNGYWHRHFLSDFYAGEYSGSFANGLVFQENPTTGDRRISGSMASLCGLENALSVGDPLQIDHSIRRILLLHSVIFAFGGVPLIYMGDEIGMRNDHSYADDPDLAQDNRWVHRPHMDWDGAGRRDDPGTVEAQIFSGIAHLAAVRRATDALHASATAEPFWTGSQRIFGLRRYSPRGEVRVLANVTGYDDQLARVDGGPFIDLLTGERLGTDVPLAAYQTRWLAPVEHE